MEPNGTAGLDHISEVALSKLRPGTVRRRADPNERGVDQQTPSLVETDHRHDPADLTLFVGLQHDRPSDDRTFRSGIS